MKKKISTAGARKNTSEDRFLVILEDIKDQFSAFGEGLSLVTERQEVLIDKVDSMDKRLTRVEDEVVFIRERLDKVEKGLGRVEERLTKVEDRLTKVEDRLTKVEDGNARIEDEIFDIKRKLSQKIDFDDLQKLEKRLVRLEKLVLAR
jgi:septal ring factor EnvC (AmiA/AmiB activator)